VIPTVDEERWQAVAAIAGESEITRERSGGWRSFGIFARIGFFILGFISASALGGLFALGGSPRVSAVMTGILCIVAAEILIATTRWYRAGLDEALHWTGVTMVCFGLAPWNHERVMFTIAGIATLIAAVRLLNPILSTIALILFAFALPDATRASFCAALAVIALALITRRIARPSIEHALAALVIVMSAAAYLFAKDIHFDALDWPIAVALLVYAIAALVIGMVFRLHAPLIALFTTLGAFAVEIRNLTGMLLEVRLIVWGTLLLAVAIALDRLLRTPRNGITSEKLRDDHFLALAELAGAAALTPHAKPEPAHGLQTGGGSYGGGGATGDF
jgi:hypothetical protein